MTDQVSEQELQQALTAWGRQRDQVALLHEGWLASFNGHAVLIHSLVVTKLPLGEAGVSLANLELDGAERFAAAIQELSRCVRRYEELKGRFDSQTG